MEQAHRSKEFSQDEELFVIDEVQELSSGSSHSLESKNSDEEGAVSDRS